MTRFNATDHDVSRGTTQSGNRLRSARALVTIGALGAGALLLTGCAPAVSHSATPQPSRNKLTISYLDNMKKKPAVVRFGEGAQEVIDRVTGENDLTNNQIIGYRRLSS